MILSFLFIFLLHDVFLVVPATGIVYYVKPSSPDAANCPGQPCQTLHYYFENVGITINQQKNVTMIFMDGMHAVQLTVPVIIYVPVVNMTGESQGVILNGSNRNGVTWLNFNRFTEVYLSNILMIKWEISVAEKLKMSKFIMSSFRLNQSPLTISTTSTDFEFALCEFQDGLLSMDVGGANVIMKNCKLTRNSMSMQYSNAILSGISHFTSTNQSSAISYYFSNITLSGVITFINNSGIRGGAIVLYSSTLNVLPGTDVLFINNYAVETGGAIYVNPSLTPDQLLSIMEQETFPESLIKRPRCFYHLLNCSVRATYTFSFSNNSAMNGGDDIYGASLEFHRLEGSGKCNLTVNVNNTGLSSVSSDPTRVCLCDSKGMS